MMAGRMETGAGAIGIVATEGPLEGPAEALYRRSIEPDGNAVARLAIVHGYGDHCGRFLHFMRWMASRGVACHGVDLRGQGLAQGRRGYVRKWDDYLDDLETFLASISSTPAAAPLFVLGHSHGGLVVGAAGESGLLRAAGARGVVLTSPYLRSRMKVPRSKVLLGRLAGLFVPWLPVGTGLQGEWMSSDPAMIEESRTDALCTHVATPRWYLGQLGAQKRVMENAAEFKLPLLVLGAGADPIADTSAAEEFTARAGSSDKACRVYPGLLHEILREKTREAVFEDILHWLRARL